MPVPHICCPCACACVCTPITASTFAFSPSIAPLSGKLVPQNAAPLCVCVCACTSTPPSIAPLSDKLVPHMLPLGACASAPIAASTSNGPGSAAPSGGKMYAADDIERLLAAQQQTLTQVRCPGSFGWWAYRATLNGCPLRSSKR